MQQIPKWPQPQEISRQNDLAQKCLALSDATGNPMVDILVVLKARVDRTGRSAEAELAAMFAEFEQPNPYPEGQLHLVIEDGELVAQEAKGCWNCAEIEREPEGPLCDACLEGPTIRSGPWGLE